MPRRPTIPWEFESVSINELDNLEYCWIKFSNQNATIVFRTPTATSLQVSYRWGSSSRQPADSTILKALRAIGIPQTVIPTPLVNENTKTYTNSTFQCCGYRRSEFLLPNTAFKDIFLPKMPLYKRMLAVREARRLTSGLDIETLKAVISHRRELDNRRHLR